MGAAARGAGRETGGLLLRCAPGRRRALSMPLCLPGSSPGDLKGRDMPISFGFDTACKVFSESIGNIGIDALSAKKYWHFIK